MATGMIDTFVVRLGNSQLLQPEQMEEVTRDLRKRFPDAKVLAQELVRRGWLTAYQVNQLSKGRELILGQYIILDLLGEGGMGEVFKARHRSLGRIVALKVLKKERLAKPDAIRRFRREMQAAARLSHPNIVMAFDADGEGDQNFFAMEYVDGIDLSTLVRKRGALKLAQAANYIHQAALGLQHAHEQGMVHRDIKPSNLLVTRDGSSVKILDVGLARVGDPDDEEVSALTRTGRVVGTPDYIAPEQVRDSHRADVRSDIYSLGCTLYFLVTGKLPFPNTGGTVVQKLMQHLTEEPVPLKTVAPQIPDNFVNVVQRMMRRKPEERYQTPAEVAAALEPFRTRATNEDSIVAVPSPASLSAASTSLNLPSESTASERSRRWLTAALVAVAVLFGLIAGIVGTRLFTPPAPQVVPKNSDPAPEIVPPSK